MKAGCRAGHGGSGWPAARVETHMCGQVSTVKVQGFLCTYMSLNDSSSTGSCDGGGTLKRERCGGGWLWSAGTPRRLVRRARRRRRRLIACRYLFQDLARHILKVAVLTELGPHFGVEVSDLVVRKGGEGGEATCGKSGCVVGRGWYERREYVDSLSSQPAAAGGAAGAAAATAATAVAVADMVAARDVVDVIPRGAPPCRRWSRPNSTTRRLGPGQVTGVRLPTTPSVCCGSLGAPRWGGNGFWTACLVFRHAHANTAGPRRGGLPTPPTVPSHPTPNKSTTSPPCCEVGLRRTEAQCVRKTP